MSSTHISSIVSSRAPITYSWVLYQALGTQRKTKGVPTIDVISIKRDRKENYTIFLQCDENYEGGKRKAPWIQKRESDTLKGKVTPGLILRLNRN